MPSKQATVLVATGGEWVENSSGRCKLILVQQFSSSAVEHHQTAELEMRDLNDLGHLPRRCWLPSTAAPVLPPPPPSSLQIIQARDGKINSPHDNLAHRSQELYFQRQTSDLVSLLDLRLTLLVTKNSHSIVAITKLPRVQPANFPDLSVSQSVNPSYCIVFEMKILLDSIKIFLLIFPDCQFRIMRHSSVHNGKVRRGTP